VVHRLPHGVRDVVGPGVEVFEDLKRALDISSGVRGA